VVPGIGTCTAEFGDTDLVCRSAVRDPHLTYYTMAWSKGPCSTPSAVTTPGDGWHEPESSDFGLNPVWTTRMFFFMHGGDNDTRWRVCPGSPLTLTQYDLVDRTQTGVTLTNFALPAEVRPT
jgi:hypothetical protein